MNPKTMAVKLLVEVVISIVAGLVADAVVEYTKARKFESVLSKELGIDKSYFG